MKTKLLLTALLAVAAIRIAPAQNCLVPPADMVAWLPGDGNAQDIRSVTQDLRTRGTVSFTPGMVGQAFTFDGSGDVLYSSFNVGNSYTIDFWIKPSSAGTQSARRAVMGNVLGQGPGKFGVITYNPQQNSFAPGNPQGAIEYFQETFAGNGSIKCFSAFGSVPFDTWTHVALAYDGQMQVNQLYINGVAVGNPQDGSSRGTGLAHVETFDNPLGLGIEAQGDSVFSRFFGQIDEVGIYRRVLDPSEISEIYAAGSAGRCKTLADADGDSIVNISDACPGTAPGSAVNVSGCTVGNCFLPPANMTNWFPGNGNANDIRGGKTATIGGAITFAEGKVGQAFNFENNATVTYPEINTGNNYTVDFWVRPMVNNGRQALVAGSATDSTGFGAITFTDTQVEYLQNGAFRVYSDYGTVPYNVYTHVALTYDGQVNRLFVNGNLVSVSGVHSEVLNQSLRLGWGFDAFSFFTGQLDEVEIFNRVLSPTEIRGMFQAGSAGKCSNGVADKTLGNISTRLPVLSGENVLIGGLIVVGQTPKRVIVRALGPSLAAAGVSGALQDPTLELYQGNTLLVMNDNWKDTQESEIAATGIAPGDNREAAIIRTLAPGNYTAVLRGKNGSTGVAILESYDLDQRQDSKLGNIATRGFVGSGDSVLIGGFIAGPQTKVVVRAIGPSLGNFGIQGPLQDPTLDLVNAQGGIVRSNDDWQQSQGAEIQAVGLQPSDSRESALIENIAAGNYTAVVRGKNGGTGVGVVEVYTLQ